MTTITTSEFKKLGPVVSRANSTIFITTVILGFLIWFAISTGTWLTLFLLDNFLKLSATLRFPLSIAAAVLTVWTFWKHVVGAIRSRSNDKHIALMLEKKYGIARNVLINTIEFEGMEYGEHQKDFIQETAKAGSLGLKAVPLRDLWQFGRLSLWWLVFAVILTGWAIYIVTMPSFAGNAFFRYANSLSDVPPLGSVSLDVIPDRNVIISEHEDLEITLVVGKLSKGEKLATYPELFYKEGQSVVDDHRGDGDEIKMQPVFGKPSIYKYTFAGVRRSFAFRIFVRDTYTHSIQVTVVPAPKMVSSSFYVTPPAYVVQPTREKLGPPHPLKCLPNSKLGIEIKLDKPVEWMRWIPADGKVDLARTGDLTWRTDVKIGNSAGPYEVEAKARSLAETLRIATGTILLKTDRKPQVRFIATSLNRIVTPGDRLALRIEAKDDYGIGKLELTARPAYGGSSPKIIRDWEFGAPPGQRGKAEKKFDLTIDASVFVPGRKYFLEVRAKDYCPGNTWGVSEPMLITVKSMDRLKAPKGSNLDKLYAALERAIHLQKNALDGTRNLASNMNNVWMDMSHKLRSDDDIQKTLNQYRERILLNQLGVREALLTAVRSAPDQTERIAMQMQRIAVNEAVEANDLVFSGCRRPFSTGGLKPVVKDVFPLGVKGHISGFKGRGRYFGFMILSSYKWTDETHIRNLSMTDKTGKPMNTSKWKVLSSRGGPNAKNALAAGGWPAKDPIPHFLVVDMGSEHDVTGVTCAASGGREHKNFKLYLTSGKAPLITPASPDKKRIAGELETQQSIQEDIYNQLLALKGKETEKVAKKDDEKLKKALGEEGFERAPSVDEKLEDFRDKLKAWTKEHNENTRLRKVVMSKPSEDFTDEDRKKLDELNLKKRKLARKFGDLVEDLARVPWDFSDKQQVKISSLLRMKAEELKDMADIAVEKAKQGAFTWNLDTMMDGKAKELNMLMPIEKHMGEGNEPGQSESGEDKASPIKMGELPSELPLRIPKLKKSMQQLQEPPMSGSAMMDHDSPSGSPMGDNIDSASAAGQMTNRTPNQKNKMKGRGNLGRSGQADGQMVASKAPNIPDDVTAMPPRMSNTPGESGSVPDEGSQPATAVGLGKSTGTPTDFGRKGRLPPDQYDKLRDFEGEVSNIRENTNQLMLALDKYNLPTTDLRKALLRLEQIQMATKGGDGVKIRQAVSDAIAHMDAAQQAVARAIELRRREQAEYRKKHQHGSDGSAETVPDGYKDIVKTYFRRLAEQSANQE